VTKDYETDESYSGESEPESAAKTKSKAAAAPPKKAAPPAPTRTASTTSVESDRKPNISKAGSGAMKKGPGGQSTLQGFFKKK
jgi:DNA polymerase delta subunit 3